MRMLRTVVTASVALLVLFHAWLFGAQLVDGELADAGLLARWAAAGLLTAALWGLRRRGVPLFRGRRAIAIWLLAAVLHGPAALDHLNSPQVPVPDVIVALAELGSILIATGLLAGALRRRFAQPVPARRRVPPAAPVFAACLAASRAHLAPRPPPRS
jgi:hypothetical protein